MNQNQPLNVNVTPDDQLVCECGEGFFIPVMKVARVKPPIIGSEDIVVPLVQSFKCFKCSKPIEDAITIREKNEKPE